MARFTLPRDLYHGKGALDALKSFDGKRAMVCVGGGSMKRFGFLDTVVANLKEAGMEVGYTISFLNSPAITIYHGQKGEQGEQGEDGITPQIGITQGEDGN